MAHSACKKMTARPWTGLKRNELPTSGVKTDDREFAFSSILEFDANILRISKKTLIVSLICRYELAFKQLMHYNTT